MGGITKYLVEERQQTFNGDVDNLMTRQEGRAVLREFPAY